MELKDFRRTAQVKDSQANKFCECCLKENPASCMGYSLCCDADVISKDVALKFSKRADVLRFVQKKISTEAEGWGNLYFREDAIIKLGTYMFNISVSKTEEEIINEVKSSLKLN